jgi:hypothetical protein
MGVDANVRPGGLGLAPIGRAEKNQRGAAEGAGDMGRAGIGAEDGLRPVEDGDEGAEGEFAPEIDETPGASSGNQGPSPTTTKRWPGIESTNSW